jgi:hypothetical protein
VLATQVVQVPDRTALEYGAGHVEELDAHSADLLDAAREDATTFACPSRPTRSSRRPFEDLRCRSGATRPPSW